MRYLFRIICATLLLVGVNFCVSYSEELPMGKIVDQFKQATDVQRDELRDFYKDREALGYGTVENVRDYNSFDEVNDIERNYYEIITAVQKTAAGNPYKVIFVYKNKDKVKSIDRGQVIERRANILRVIDERLWISVWLYEGEFTPEEKEQFKYK